VTVKTKGLSEHWSGKFMRWKFWETDKGFESEFNFVKLQLWLYRLGGREYLGLLRALKDAAELSEVSHLQFN
jgi:hypothetical protein